MAYSVAEDRINERADVARRILELSDTIEEAINYMIVKLDMLNGEIGVSSEMLKDVGEGLISLENAASAISGPLGAEPEDVMLLSQEYDMLSERMDALIDAYVEERTSDFPVLGKMLRESFTEYEKILTRCFRNIAVM